MTGRKLLILTISIGLLVLLVSNGVKAQNVDTGGSGSGELADVCDPNYVPDDVLGPNKPMPTPTPYCVPPCDPNYVPDDVLGPNKPMPTPTPYCAPPCDPNYVPDDVLGPNKPMPTPTPLCWPYGNSSPDDGSDSGDGSGTNPGSSSSSSSSGPRTWGPTEPPIELEVPDCPGITRKIDASHLPPSIYPKPTCSGASNGSMPVSNNGLGQPTGKYGTGDGAPAAGTLFWVITGGKVYPIGQGYGMTTFAEGNDWYTYCNEYGTPGHCGVDVGVPQGTLLYTPVAGRVICAGTGVTVDPNIDGCAKFPSESGTPGENGRFQLELANGDMLIFGHMSKITVQPGQMLNAGDPVGLSGTFNGDHFHIEYRAKTADGWTTYDPREIFDVPANGSSTSATPDGSSTVNPVSAQAPQTSSEGGQVAAAVTTTATMKAMQEKYGFFEPTGQSGIDFAKYANEFAIERDLAVKYAPLFNLEPEMVVWWTYAEGAVPYDSYNYQNCLQMNPPLPLDQSCSAIGYGDWQIGYGQQYAAGLDAGMEEVFQKTNGDPNDKALVQKVGQNVLTKAGVNKTFPSMTVAELMANESANRDWIFALQRDQPISVYLTAFEIRQDLDGRPNETYYEITKHWNYTDEMWQNYSNVMNDVINNWGVASTGVIAGSCTTSTNSSSSSCSTQEDVLSGMTAEEFIDKLNPMIPDFKKVAECGDVPWQMMASINLREVGLSKEYNGSGAGGAEGPWQIDPTSELWGTVDHFDFVEAGCAVAKTELQNKAKNGPVGRPLRADMDPNNHDDEVSIKDAFFGYNGRGGWQNNVAKGCTPAFDGHEDWNFDCSAYVMNNWDSNHTDMVINDDFYDPNDGTWKTFYKLFNSTYAADGTILVYGGGCTTATGVVNGMALPTDAGHGINSQFFNEWGHIGVDIANSPGDPVFAIADGDILNSGWDERGGYYVLQHVPAGVAGNTNERWVYYGHIAPTGFPEPGAQVKAGQQIATTGPHLVTRNGVEVSNGVQDGPHLHFDIRTTTSGAGDPSIHVNPCHIDLFKQGYPALDCVNFGSEGATW